MTDAEPKNPIRNFKLTIEYDGQAYAGWQRQIDQPTIQGTLEHAIATMAAQSITLAGSGRTDAGVHALGQVASFKCRTRLTAHIFLKGLNALLPRDIVVRHCETVPSRFHARFDATRKLYRYCILNDPAPKAIGRQYAWHIRAPLNTRAMRMACQAITGQHDFSAFTGSGSQPHSTVRTILSAQINRASGNMIHFEVLGEGFLKHMVRNLVGTLVEIGQGRRTADDMTRILVSRDRGQAGITAPAQGLFLVQVDYDD